MNLALEEKEVGKQIGMKLKKFRMHKMAETGMTLEQFIDKLGMTDEELSACEDGDITPENIPNLYALYSRYGMNLNYLFENKKSFLDREAALGPVMKRILDNRTGRFDDYLSLLLKMRDPEIESFVFQLMNMLSSLDWRSQKWR